MGMLVAEAGLARPLDGGEDLVADGVGVVDALEHADVGAEGAAGVGLAVRSRGAAAGGLHDDVGDAEHPLQRALPDLDVLHVLEADGRLVDHPDAAADAQAAVGEHVPRRVVAQVDADVGDDVGQDHQRDEERRQHETEDRYREADGDPGDDRQDVARNQRDPEQEFQVGEVARGRAKRPDGAAVRRQRRRMRRYLEEPDDAGPHAAIDPRRGGVDVLAHAPPPGVPMRPSSRRSASRMSDSSASASSPSAFAAEAVAGCGVA
jgi:hypothetical protein